MTAQRLRKNVQITAQPNSYGSLLVGYALRIIKSENGSPPNNVVAWESSGFGYINGRPIRSVSQLSNTHEDGQPRTKIYEIRSERGPAAVLAWHGGPLKDSTKLTAGKRTAEKTLDTPLPDGIIRGPYSNPSPGSRQSPAGPAYPLPGLPPAPGPGTFPPMPAPGSTPRWW